MNSRIPDSKAPTNIKIQIIQINKVIHYKSFLIDLSESLFMINLWVCALYLICQVIYFILKQILLHHALSTCGLFNEHIILHLYVYIELMLNYWQDDLWLATLIIFVSRLFYFWCFISHVLHDCDATQLHFL